jgi:nitronate monooxygenase
MPTAARAPTIAPAIDTIRIPSLQQHRAGMSTFSPTQGLLGLLNIDLPLIQAPMAGVSTPSLAAAVTNAGGLGSIGIGAVDASAARVMIAELRRRTDGPFNVNLFCHRPATVRSSVEAAWIERLRPVFASLGAQPPAQLGEIYRSCVADEAMLQMLLEERPRVVSFHFGLPPRDVIRALQGAGIVLLATATNLDEAQEIAQAGIDAVVAQGYEAGGHRGMFDPDARDEQLGTLALTRLIVRHLALPVIAAGGIMDGAGIAAALRLGAVAAQLGTAFVACDESAADEHYRGLLGGPAALRTVMTRAISGRPARGMANRFSAFGAEIPPADVPDYPIAYAAGKALHAAAKARGDWGFGAHWAGQGAPLARAMPAAELVARLAAEMREVVQGEFAQQDVSPAIPAP